MRMIGTFGEIENAILDRLSNIRTPPVHRGIDSCIDRVGEQRSDQFIIVMKIFEEIPLNGDILRTDDS